MMIYEFNQAFSKTSSYVCRASILFHLKCYPLADIYLVDPSFLLYDLKMLQFSIFDQRTIESKAIIMLVSLVNDYHVTYFQPKSAPATSYQQLRLFIERSFTLFKVFTPYHKSVVNTTSAFATPSLAVRIV